MPERNDNTRDDGINNNTSFRIALLERWREAIDVFHSKVILLLKAIAVPSAKHPLWIAITIAVFSLGLLGAGLGTNFYFETDGTAMWIPLGSYPLQHLRWIADESGFPQQERVFQFLIHRATGSESVLEIDAVERVFDVMETITRTSGYESLCSLFSAGVCREMSVASLWSGSREAFEATVAQGGLDAVIDVLSETQLPTGETFTRSTIMGTPNPPLHADRTNVSDLTPEERRLTSALSFQGFVFLPPSESDSKEFEGDALERIFRLREEWVNEISNPYRLEVFTSRSLDDEITRSVENDIPLMGLAILIMCVFCCVVFYRRGRDRAFAQCLLGLGAIVTILLALAAAYGLMFCVGVSFTSMTQVFPFILLGVGLDDTFIITGTFAHTDPRKSFHDRIADVMQESGITMTVTTLTTFFAFTLGSLITSIPAIRWFCWYAGAAILIDFVYQISFFIALMALDHRNLETNHCGVFHCFKRTRHDSTPSAADDNQEDEEEEEEVEEKALAAERFMVKYAKFLLRPHVKAIVIAVFAILLGVGCWFSTQVTQDFNFLDLAPDDSYIAPFFDAFHAKCSPESDVFMEGAIYFRDVDFSSLEIQTAMRDYVQDIVDLDSVTYSPEHLWLDDFDSFVSSSQYYNTTNTNLTSLSFEEQVGIFLETEPYKGIYSRDIVLNHHGVMTASRTHFKFDQVSHYSVKEQTDALLSERAVTRAQRINQGKSDWPFFTFSEMYDVWEFYVVIVDELIVATCVTLAAVSLMALIFIRHPAASLFIAPAVAMVYIELLGVIYVAGLHINPITSVSLVMSVGLAIDFCVHLVSKFFELQRTERSARITEALRTLGAPVAVGGFSTFLGTLPLSLSSSEIFRTLFVVFFGIVVFGMGYGLVLMPVVLSLDMPRMKSRECLDTEENRATKTVEPNEKGDIANAETLHNDNVKSLEE